MKASQSITSIALLGTARDVPFPEAPYKVLEAPWRTIDTQDRPRAVLQAAALEASALRSGAQLVQNIPLSEKAPLEARSHSPAPAATALQRMLAGDFSQGIPEWLRTADEAQLIAPFRLLPDLLDRGQRDRTLRPLISRIAGQRGIWLARQQVQWEWLLQSTSVEDAEWENGSPDKRIAWLRQIRQSDPEKATESITAEWVNESADFREAITQLAATCPHPCEEVWLENLALKERRQSTRDAATNALARIPNSAFLKRTTARIQQILRYRRSGLSKVLSLNPPETLATEWINDGIRAKPPQGTGEKAWWMRQVLSQAPIQQWAAILDLSLEQIFKAKLDPDWTEVIEQAWLESIQRFPEAECIEGICVRMAKQANKQNTPQLSQILPRCLQQVDRNTLASLLEKLPLSKELLIVLLTKLRPALCPKLQPKLSRLLEECWKDKQLYLTRPDAIALAYCIRPEAITPTLQTIAKLPELSSVAEAFANTLEFRNSYLPHLLKPVSKK